jgi:UPF0755 protein
MQKTISNFLSKKQWLIVIASFFVFVGIGYYLLFFPINYSIEEPIIFEIKKGESFSIVSEKLYQLGIVKNKFVFKTAAIIYGADNRIKAARFKIKKGLSYLDLIDLLTNGPADYLKTIKIYNGSILKNIVITLQQELKVDSSTVLKLANDKDFLKSLNISANSLEGYLLPGIYNIYENSEAEEVISILTNSLNEFLNDSLNIQSQKNNFNKHQILTIASIIEGETNFKDEMPLISAVYHNRLKKGMKLQADPTIQYALDGGWRRLTYSDLNMESPYNTYKYYGLPPGPINNPGKDAITAALFPADVDYLFFVADGNGKHKFAKTYKEHLSNVKDYRKWLNSKKSE